MMRKFAFWVAVFSGTLPTLSYSETLFYCQTTQGKQVRVQKQNDTITYAFGKSLNNPELALVKPRSDVHIGHEAYSGGGASIISIPNDGYIYEIRSGIRKISWEANASKTHEDFGELTVLRDDKTLAEIKCRPETIRPK